MSEGDTTELGRNPDEHARAVDVDAVRALYELIGRDREALAELVDAFVEDTPGSLAELRRGADDGDTAVAGRAAHTLKSNATTFGAAELVSLCRRLEIAARADELAGSAHLIDRVDVQLVLVCRELTTLRDGERL
jgi:HPt (histidine-containing phosphotransfer) domain-containing protein